MSRLPPDCVSACLLQILYSEVVIDIYTSCPFLSHARMPFEHENNARYGNSVRLFVRLSVLDTLVLWQNG